VINQKRQSKEENKKTNEDNIYKCKILNEYENNEELTGKDIFECYSENLDIMEA